MSDSDERARRELIAQLASRPGALPTRALGRLRRTANALIRGRSALRPGDQIDPAVVEKLVHSLGELKGIAMKAGQLLSYVDEGLAPEVSELLGTLQTWSPPTPFPAIEQILRDDLGDSADALLATLERTPISSASIGQVHRARLPTGAEVAVKVRHPGIEEAIRSDFKAAGAGAVLARLLAPGADIGSLIEEAKQAFLEECDYHLEARRQERFGELYAEHPQIRIPAIYRAWSSERVLTMGWQEGVGLDAFLQREPSTEARLRVSRSLYEFYVGSLYRHGIFNGDPHPGNLLFRADGDLVILDHGCVREFDRQTVAALVALSRAVRKDDASAIRAALVDLGAKAPETAESYRVTRELLRAFYEPSLQAGAHPVRSRMPPTTAELIANKRSILKLHLPGKLLFLFRIRFGLYALLSRLGAEIDLYSLEEQLIAQSMA